MRRRKSIISIITSKRAISCAKQTVDTLVKRNYVKFPFERIYVFWGREKKIVRKKLWEMKYCWKCRWKKCTLLITLFSHRRTDEIRQTNTQTKVKHKKHVIFHMLNIIFFCLYIIDCLVTRLCVTDRDK